MANSETLITLVELRALLGNPSPSRQTLWRWIQRGVMPKPLDGPGRRLLWRKADIQEWLASL